MRLVGQRNGRFIDQFQSKVRIHNSSQFQEQK